MNQEQIDVIEAALHGLAYGHPKGIKNDVLDRIAKITGGIRTIPAACIPVLRDAIAHHGYFAPARQGEGSEPTG